MPCVERLPGPARPDAVCLDAAGTLITPASPVGETYAEYARRHGARVEPAALEDAFRAELPRMPPLAFPGAAPGSLEALEREWWRTLVGRVLERAHARCDLDACFPALYAHYADPGAWRAWAEVPATLDAVRHIGCRIAVVSNFDSRLPAILEGLALASRTDALVWSSAAGAAKPDPAIFGVALAALGATPGRCVHVGDSESDDYEGARAAGLHALLLDRRDRHSRHPHRVASLRGLLDWLARDPASRA